jgi:predicted alpha/beta-fold hydrolase
MGSLHLPGPYRAPLFLANGHLQTVLPALFRRVPARYERKRLILPDGDFVDVDWMRNGHNRVAILSHGLGGHSRRAYIAGMARALAHEGWDIVAWNFRGCSGEPNSMPVFTHNGSTDDLAAVIEHVRRVGHYGQIALIGFSMGGNITLLYLGRAGQSAPAEIRGAVAFSVPCDLPGASEAFSRPRNRIYMNRFLHQLRDHVKVMARRFPDKFPLDDLHTIRNFQEFDDRYTAPLHGFRNALDYWQRSSSKPLIQAIARPTLIVNAVNDPFLSPSCFPFEEAAANPLVTLMAPETGGHCGFITFNRAGRFWSEEIACRALESACGR